MLCNLLISDQFINDKRMSKTLEEAFRELIMRNKCYEHSLRYPIKDKNEKAKFLKGKKLPEERMRDYLSVAGWICVQIELWNPADKTLKECFSELIKNRKWHQYSSRSYFSAKNDKAKFIHGENISEEYIREYLSAAGYTIKQYELWEKYKF